MIVLRRTTPATVPARYRRMAPRTALPFVLLAATFIYDRQIYVSGKPLPAPGKPISANAR